MKNPILRVDTPFLREQEIPALTLKEVTQLLKACMDEFDGSCVAGAALMIFAGIRPQEVERPKSAKKPAGAEERNHGCLTACGIPMPAITPSTSRTTTCCKWKWATAPPPCSARGT